MNNIKIEKNSENSTNKNKRYKAILNNGKIVNFGYPGGSTYKNYLDKLKRENFIKRHVNAKYEKQKNQYSQFNFLIIY